IPSTIAPSDPIPTHTAYAVPIGSDRAATASNTMLATIAIPVSKLGTNFVNPSVYFSPIAHPASKNPATMSNTHGIQKTSHTAIQKCRAVPPPVSRFRTSKTPRRLQIPSILPRIPPPQKLNQFLHLRMRPIPLKFLHRHRDRLVLAIEK